MDTQEKFLAVTRLLNNYHGIFSQIWVMGRPRLTDKIPTAAVAFNRDGGFVEFLFNQKFMESLSITELCFVVAHECLHVILNHGKRLQKLNPQAGNMSADITINEMLINHFGFSRELPLIKNLPACLISTCFKDKEHLIAKEREFEYYYEKLMEDGQSGGGQGFDDHSQLPQEVLDDIRDAINKLSKEELETLKNNLKAGDGSSFEWITTALKPKKIRTWENVIRKWTIAAYKTKMQTQWKITNRRFSVVEQYSELLIPSDYDVDEKMATKIDMVFFMDVSGSCHSDSEKFFAAARSVPRDKFFIEPYAFDTEIIKINLSDDKLPNGGGTSFHQLEEHLQKKKTYPAAVFVLTDGYGTDVAPKYPDRWHVFLTSEQKDNFKGPVNFHKFADIMKCM